MRMENSKPAKEQTKSNNEKTDDRDKPPHGDDLSTQAKAYDLQGKLKFD